MTCPNCQQPTTPAEERCPRCATPLLTLAPGTRLNHRYVITQPISRRGVVTYAATDGHDGQTVTLLEYLPAGSRRMGPLAILDADGQVGRDSWAKRIDRWRQVSTPALQRVSDVFQQHGTTYAVLPGSPDQDAAGLTLQGGQVEPLLRSLLPALHALHGTGAAGPFHVTALPPLLTPEPQTTWPAIFCAPEVMAGHAPTPSADLYALAGLILSAASGQALPTPTERDRGRPLPVLSADVPAAVQETLTACLALDASVRVQTAAQALARLSVRTPQVTTAATPRWIRPAHRSWITHLHLRGGLLSSTGPDQQVIIHDRAGSVVWRLDGLLGKPVGLISTPSMTVVADATGTVHTWARGHHTALRGSVSIERLAALPGDQVVTINDDRTMALWDSEPLKRRGTTSLPLDWITAMTATPGGTILLGDGRGGLWQFDAETTQVIQRGPGPVAGAVTCIAATLHAVFTVSGTALVIWPDAQAPAVVWTAPHIIRAVVSDPAGDRVFVAAGRDIYQVTVQGGHAALLYSAPAPILALALDGPDLAAGTETGILVMLTTPDVPPA